MMPSGPKLEDAVTGLGEQFVLVPRNPTKEMLEAGWYEAHDEDAGGVWQEMIKAWEERQTQDREPREKT